MFVAHSFLNFFIASGSGQAVLTMPVMIPLSDLMHISPQLSILAYQFGEGWTNAIIPTAPVTMAALGMAGIPWLKWAKWNIHLQIILAVLSALLLIPPYLMGW
ncbi:MAG: TIGR00366 family protein, partial [Elusimicrobiaceae bacterium]|nr:TIGR00366 family protein [Elusimicrobiaceae bacterium]